MRRNLDGTLGPQHQAEDTGIELRPQEDNMPTIIDPPLKTGAEERLIQAALRWDELGHVGPEVDPDYCGCDDDTAESELRRSLDAVKAERA